MINNITRFMDTHPIGRIFTLGRKKAVWKRVTELKTGVKIAIEKDGKLDWDEIVSVAKVGRERVYDIEVEGTHNFVGNGILAHNTYISGDVGVGTGTVAAKLHVVGSATTGATFLVNNPAIVASGNVAAIQADALTGGTGLDISVDGITTGKGLNLSSTSTAYTSGNLVSVDWTPGSSTTATGDLFKISIGANGTTTGNLFDIEDAGTSLFSVSETGITSALPHAFTAAGDVSIAYDIVLTNQTASKISAYGPLTIEAGESFESNNLTLKTYNQGSVYIDSSVTTGTAVNISNTTLTSGAGISYTGPSSTGITGSVLSLTSDVGSSGELVNLSPDFSGSAVTGYGVYLSGTDSTSSANTDYGIYSTLALTGNAAKTGVGVYSNLTSTSTTADTILALDAATSVTGAITTGTRNIYGLRSQPVNNGVSTGGSSTNVYGVYSKVANTVGAGGTATGYGLYVGNGTFNTTGTTTQYRLHLESFSPAPVGEAGPFTLGASRPNPKPPLPSWNLSTRCTSDRLLW